MVSQTCRLALVTVQICNRGVTCFTSDEFLILTRQTVVLLYSHYAAIIGESVTIVKNEQWGGMELHFTNLIFIIFQVKRSDTLLFFLLL